MKRLIGLVLVLTVLLSLSSCKKEEGFWNNVSASESSGGQVPEIEWLEPDDPIVLEHKANLQMLYGEVWHNDIYEKDAIEIPEVEAEETVEGALWFPPVNNTAPLEEIAPTISYKLALEGYNISSYYPDNPEDYTAQALNENAFPIAFFRKVNDLYYYTVCKVEGGGYMYYFFMANSDVTYEQAAKADGRPLEYNADGSVEPDTSTEHLYRADLANLTGVDMTKEAIWRASIYSEKALGSCDAIRNSLPVSATDSIQEGSELKDATAIDPAARLGIDAINRMIDKVGAADATDAEKYQLIRDFFNKYGTSPAIIKLLCEDGILYLDYASYCEVSIQDADYDYYKEYMSPNPEKLYLFGLGGGYFYSNYLSQNTSIPIPSESNTALLQILPQDYLT